MSVRDFLRILTRAALLLASCAVVLIAWRLLLHTR